MCFLSICYAALIEIHATHCGIWAKWRNWSKYWGFIREREQGGPWNRSQWAVSGCTVCLLGFPARLEMGREGSGYWSGAGIVLRLAKGWKRSKIQQPRTHFASF